MASGSNPVMEDDELKGDGKKRKFKPLEAVRKFFGKSKRKSKDEQVSVVAVKAKSTTALHHDPDYDDDDDDGGFKNRQPRPLGGNRSISEDSIFSPEPKEPNLQALKKAAVSEESLPKTAFQAELFSKLNKRRSQYSDEDDGLPHSPTPPVTTADIIMGGPLKPLPAGGRSTSRESDNSLISNDPSDNEEDDPFKSHWKSAVPSKLSKKPGKSGGGSEAPIDFDNVGQTELLKSDLAKDKISIKPRARKTNRQSRKMRESQSPHGLPSLNEEAGSRARADTASTSSMPEFLMDTDRPEDLGSSIAPLSSSPKPDLPTPRRSPFTKQTSEPIAPRPTSMPVFVTPSKPAPRQEKPKVEDKRASVFSSVKSPNVKDDEKRVYEKSELKSPAVKDEDKRGVGFNTELKSPALKEDDKRTTPSSDVKSPAGQDESTASLKPGVRSPAGKEEEKRGGSKFDLRATPSKDEIGGKGDGGKGEGEGRGKALPTSKSLESVKKESEGVSPSETAQGGSLMTRSLYAAPSTKNSETSSTTKSKVDFLASSMKPPGSSGFTSHRPAAPAESESSPVSLPSVHTTTKTAPPANTSPSSSPSKSSSSSASPGVSKREGLRQTDSQVSPAFSPKDDYKLRRQSRSKTLPEHTVPKDEPFATRVQRAASHRVEATSSQNASPETSPRHKERVVEPSKSKEPEWFALARKKAGRQESEEKKETATPAKDSGVKDSVTPAEVSVSSTPVSRDDSVSSAVSSSVPSAEETASNMTVSSASSKFERFSEKNSDVSRQRGGSVKTSPSKTPVFANRGSSVKIQSTKTGLSLTGTSSVSDSPAPKPTPVSVKSATPSSGANQEETKEEAKSSESSPTKELPKWKTQNVKTATPTVSSNTPVSSRFPSVKPSSQSTPATFTAPATKTDPKPVSSPAKKTLNKTPSEEKEKSSVPAWRANLNQKKTAPSEIKIELIESTSSSPANTSTAKKDDVAKKDNVSKKEDSPTKAPSSSKDVQPDQCRSSAGTTSRTSKVMNLLKNFENVQGVS